ncbi:hypothetical protein ISCGN_017763 [Ixodes scapularis]
MLPKKGGFDLSMAVRVTNAQNVTSFGVPDEMVLHILNSSDSVPADIQGTDKPFTTQAVKTEAKHQTVASASTKPGGNSTSPETKETEVDVEEQPLDTSRTVILTTAGVLFTLSLLITAFTVYELSRPTVPRREVSE